MTSDRVTRWIGYWNGYWFPETTALRLAICRILIVASQLFLFFPSLEKQHSFLTPFRGFIEPQALVVWISWIVPTDVFATTPVFTAIYWATVVAGIATLVGFVTRPSAFLFALGNWVLFAHEYSYGEDHHREAILCIFLMLLAFSPSGRCLSVDSVVRRARFGSGEVGLKVSNKMETAAWPLKLTQVLLGFVYLSTGVSKLLFGGLAWMNGFTLQQWILTSAIDRDLALGVWLAQQHTLCMLLSIGVILFEVFFCLTLVFPRTIPYFLVAGVLFHSGIYLFEGSHFFQYIVLYVVFLDFEKLLTSCRTRFGRGSGRLATAKPVVGV